MSLNQSFVPIPVFKNIQSNNQILFSVLVVNFVSLNLHVLYIQHVKTANTQYVPSVEVSNK